MINVDVKWTLIINVYCNHIYSSVTKGCDYKRQLQTPFTLSIGPLR